MTESVVAGIRGPDPAKVAAVRLVQRLAADGLSVRRIVTQLNAGGIASTSGKRWHVKTVHAALKIALG